MRMLEKNILHTYWEINSGYELVVVLSEKLFQTDFTVKDFTLKHK